MQLNLDLSFDPKWENISKFRDFLTEFLLKDILTSVEAQKISVAVSEMMENIVKYSPVVGAKIHLQKDKASIIIRITNITTIKELSNFEEIMKEISGIDSGEGFKQKMIDLLNRDNQKSQLGLARIQHECSGKITYTTSDDLAFILPEGHPRREDKTLKLLSIQLSIPIEAKSLQHTI